MDVENLWQVFTPSDVVEKMLSLRKNSGRCLEPSCWDGAFFSAVPGCVGIEIDATKAPEWAIVADFFDYPVSEKFETVIGNPPYVGFGRIPDSTKAKLASRETLLDGRANLYLHFIEKSLDHLSENGELIFIVPREFSKLTSAKRLNGKMYRLGTITHHEETGDARIFAGATPNCSIFRFQKGLFDRVMDDGRTFVEKDGHLNFVENGAEWADFSRFFYVKVGAVSGNDPLFASPDGNADFVCSKTATTGETRRMIYEIPHPELEPHKEKLKERKLKRFDDSNWWKWGRSNPKETGPRIYVNNKTRNPKPFFTHPSAWFDGSVLGIFPKTGVPVDKAAEILNGVDWKSLGFVCDGRFIFGQRTLEKAMLPKWAVEKLEKLSENPN